MAVTKKTFSTTTYSDLASWMQANLVPGYFAAVTYDSGTNTVTCKNGDGDTVLTIATDANSYVIITLYINGSANVSKSYQYFRIIDAVYLSANGLIFHFAFEYSGVYGVDILLTKTNNGDAAVVFPNDNAGLVGQVSTLYSGIHCSAWGDETTGADFSFVPSNANQTQIVPFVSYPQFGSVSYMPNAYYVLHGQYYNMGLGTILIDGMIYLTNGYWAIKDGPLS